MLEELEDDVAAMPVAAHRQECVPVNDQHNPQMMFAGLDITYTGQVLEPRPWTEAQSAWAAELLSKAPAGPVLELCAGAGHIGLGAIQDTSRQLIMVDFNPVAKRLAHHNAVINGLAWQVEFRLARIEEALGSEERYPLIVADPPWVRSLETSKFPEDPVEAIDGGDDGLNLARSCVELIDVHLADGGAALLQLGNAPQVELIAEHAKHRVDGALSVHETRNFDDGVIVRLGR